MVAHEASTDPQLGDPPSFSTRISPAVLSLAAAESRLHHGHGYPPVVRATDCVHPPPRQVGSNATIPAHGARFRARGVHGVNTGRHSLRSRLTVDFTAPRGYR